MSVFRGPTPVCCGLGVPQQQVLFCEFQPQFTTRRVFVKLSTKEEKLRHGIRQLEASFEVALRFLGHSQPLKCLSELVMGVVLKRIYRHDNTKIGGGGMKVAGVKVQKSAQHNSTREMSFLR